MITFEDWKANAKVLKIKGDNGKKAEVFVVVPQFGNDKMKVEHYYLPFCYYTYDCCGYPAIECDKILVDPDKAFFNEQEAKEYADEVNKELENEK